MIDHWTKEFFSFCESLSEDLDQFFADMEELTEEVVQEVETAITEDLEIWEELWENLFWDDEWLEAEPESNGDFGFTSKVTPDENTHPACQGCHHYHGYVYGGNLFVCGMHPYGWEGENCPDWDGN